MRIDPKNLSAAYEAQLKSNLTSNSKEEIKSDKAMQDRVVLSDDYRKNSGIEGAKKKLIDEIEKGASPDKLFRLKNEIQSGTYNVSSEDIAQAIISSFHKNNG